MEKILLKFKNDTYEDVEAYRVFNELQLKCEIIKQDCCFSIMVQVGEMNITYDDIATTQYEIFECPICGKIEFEISSIF